MPSQPATTLAGLGTAIRNAASVQIVPQNNPCRTVNDLRRPDQDQQAGGRAEGHEDRLKQVHNANFSSSTFSPSLTAAVDFWPLWRLSGV